MGKIEIDREWCLMAARREGDEECGAGILAADPLFFNTCPDCCGEGGHEVSAASWDDPYCTRTVVCEACNGSGWICI